MIGSVLASHENEMEKDSRQKFDDLSDLLSEHCRWPIECLAGAELDVIYGAGTLCLPGHDWILYSDRAVNNTPVLKSSSPYTRC